MQAGLEELVRSGFLVEKDTDDYKQYRQTVEILKLMSREKPGMKTYTILPTTGCNARCVYCYEEGMPVSSMTDEDCRTCCFLPQCTAFFKNGCPDHFAYCREFRQIETEEALRRLPAEA